MKDFLLNNRYKKFRRRLFSAISIVIGIVSIIIEHFASRETYIPGTVPSLNTESPFKWILLFLFGVAITWIVYAIAIWIAKAFPERD